MPVGPLIDISPPVGPGSPVWPGDTPYARTVHWPMGGESPVEVGTLTTTGHVGAHADAPAHVVPGGVPIDAVPLDAYVGPCQVVHCLAAHPGRALVSADEVRAALAGAPGPVAPRLLLRTYATAPTGWDDDLPGLAPDLVRWFAGQGGVLIGVDTASLDPVASKEMAAHRAAVEHGMAILEGLALADVPEGRYELLALPLRLVDADASPVRAVLRSVGDPS